MKLCTAVRGYLFTSQTENKSPNTLGVIRRDLDIFAKWFLGSPSEEITEERDEEIAAITTEKIRAFIEHEQRRGVSAHTVHQEYRVLRAFLRWSIREGILTVDPTTRIKPPQLPDLLPKAMEPAQVAALLGRLKKDRTPRGRRNELMIHTLLGTGLRASELLALNVSSFFADSSYLLVKQGKGRKDRVVPAEPMLNKELWKYVNGWRCQLARKDEPALFVDKNGRRLALHGLQVMCHRQLKAINVEGSVHIFRHTFASIYLRNGGSLETLRRILGHRSVETTIRYVSLLPNDLVNQQMKVSPLESVMR